MGTIAQLYRAIYSQLRHVSTIGKKNLLSSNTSSTCPHNMANFGPLTAEMSSGFASCQRYCTASSSGRQPDFAALNRRRHLCSEGRPSRSALAHILAQFITVHKNTIIICFPCFLACFHTVGWLTGRTCGL